MPAIQFTGLASGLDTDSIVQAMLMTQKNKIDTAENEKELLKLKQDEWKKVNDSINEFYTKYVDKLRKQSTFQSYITSTTSDAVSVSKTGSMTEGIHTLKNIKVAQGVSETGELDKNITSKTKTFKEMGITFEGSNKIKLSGKDENGEDVIKEIEITQEDSLETVEKKMEKANSDLALNFDLKNHKLFLATKATGKGATLKAEFDNCELFEKLGFKKLTDKDGNTTTGNSWNFKGENAKYTYNGVDYESETNDIEINGIKLTLERDTNTNEEVNVKVKSDPEALVSFMKEFVDAYNTLLDSLNDKYSAVKVSKMLLTDEEKEKMTDKEIDEYQDSIKKSLLRRDPSLYKVIDALRSSMQSIFDDGKYKSLSAVGIKTGSYTENGKLVFDEKGQEKFKECVEENLEEVMKLFTASEDATTTSNSRNTGLGTKLYKSITSMRNRVEGLKSYQSYYNDKITESEIKTYTSKIDDLKDKYDSLEKMYRKKFTAMEKALSQINSQSAAFTNMLG